MNEPSTPTDTPQPETHTCHTCGYSWLHGRHGGHDCLGRLKAQLDAQATKITELREVLRVLLEHEGAESYGNYRAVVVAAIGPTNKGVVS